MDGLGALHAAARDGDASLVRVVSWRDALPLVASHAAVLLYYKHTYDRSASPFFSC